MIDSKSAVILLAGILGAFASDAQEEETPETYRELFERTYRFQRDVPPVSGSATEKLEALARRLHQAGERAFPVLTEIFSSTDEVEKKTAIVSFFIVHGGEKTELLSLVRDELGKMVLEDRIHEDRNRPYLCQSIMLLGQDGDANDLDAMRDLQASKISIVKQFAETAEKDLRQEAELRRTLAQWEGPQELSNVITELSAAAPVDRRRSVAAMVRIVRKEVALPRWERNYLIGDIAHILIELRDEPAILAAFAEDLEKFGDPNQFDAVAALAACEDPAAMEAIEQFVRGKMEEIPETDPGPPEELLSPIGEPIGYGEDPALSFVMLLRDLTESGNPDAMACARRLRNEFAEVARGSDFRIQVLDVLDRELDGIFGYWWRRGKGWLWVVVLAAASSMLFWKARSRRPTNGPCRAPGGSGENG